MVGFPVPLPLLALGGCAIVCAGAWLHGRASGLDQCALERAAATAQAQQEAHGRYVAAVAHGNALAARLAERERQIHALKTEYLTYATSITGHCPADLGVLVDAAAAGKPVPDAARQPPDPAATIAAAAVAANVATNYAIARACQAQLNTLIDWHTRPEKGVK